ncbi:MAG: CopG family transcriptional regulator [Pyrinomonadaceae bacterium]
MTTAQIVLTDLQMDALHKLSAKTGRAEDELLQEAVNKLISEADVDKQNWLQSLRKAKGIWKDRDDLPDFQQLRKEFDTFADWNEEE